MTEDKRNALFLSLGRLEGKMDAVISLCNTHSDTLEKHDERVRELESSRSALIGAVAILSTAISAAVAWFSR
jgi:hypothetical protein